MAVTLNRLTIREMDMVRHVARAVDGLCCAIGAPRA